MSKLLVPVVAALACLACQPKLRPFSDAEVGLTVQLPGEPIVRRWTAPTPIGTADFRRYALDLDGVTYAILWIEFPVQRAPAGVVYDKVLPEELGGVKTNLPFSHQGLVGREYRGTDKGGRAYVQRAFAVGRRVYSVGYFQQTIDAAKQLAFLDSLVLVPATLDALRKLKVCAPFECRAVTPKEGRFTVQLPMEPKMTEETLESELGELHVKTFTADTTPVRSILRYVDFSPSPDAPKPDVAAFARRLLEPLKGRKLRSVEARLSFNAALGFVIDEDADAESGELMSISRTALVGHRLYQATLSFPAGELPEDEIELFFGSIAIDKVPGATP